VAGTCVLSMSMYLDGRGNGQRGRKGGCNWEGTDAECSSTLGAGKISRLVSVTFVLSIALRPSAEDRVCGMAVHAEQELGRFIRL
jgi:hypothetical protein